MTFAPLSLLFGVLGLVVGSFFGLVSVRWPLGEDVVRGRSRCRACGRTLSWPDLVPVASYALTRGRCRTCSAAIPFRYPLIELAAGGIGVWAPLIGSNLTETILTAVLGWQFLLVAVIDLEHNWWLPVPMGNHRGPTTGLSPAVEAQGLVAADPITERTRTLEFDDAERVVPAVDPQPPHQGVIDDVGPPRTEAVVQRARQDQA